MKIIIRTTAQKALNINDFQNSKIDKPQQKNLKGGYIGVEDLLAI